jgi:hypothetical protein
MASFLSTLFSRGQSENENKGQIFPAESFSVVQGQVNDKPIIGSLNMEYKNYDKKDQYPWCLKIAIGLELENLHDNGLPKQEESEIANRLEDELMEKIKTLATAHYIGHLFNDTFLDVYVYLNDPKKVHEFLQTQINKEGLIRGFGYEISEDPKWTIVQGLLKQ